MRAILPFLGLMGVLALAGGSLQAAATPENEDHHPLFDKIDANHDGFISLAEWEAWRSEHRHREQGAGGPPEGAHLTMQSLAHGPNAGAPTGAGTPPSTPSTAPVPPVHPHGTPGNHEDRHPLFDKIDTNHDGRISLAEWIAFREAHPHHKKSKVAP